MSTGPTTREPHGAHADSQAGLVSVIAESAYPQMTAGARVRVVDMGAHLSGHGVEIDFRPTISNEGYALIAVPGLRPAKALALLRDAARAARAAAADPGALTLVHRLRSLVPWPNDDRRLDIYDFDDALYLGATEAHRVRLGVFKREASRSLRYMRLARIVLAGNRLLADAARLHARRVEVVPSCVDPSVQPMRKHRDAETLTLGWIGSETTSRYLRPALDAVDDLQRRGTSLRLLLMGASASIRAPWIEHRPWSVDHERKMLTEVDIGLMPLPDDPWARGKCGYKLLRYFSAGLPAIASPVGINADLIDNGRGIAASSRAEWSDAIVGLGRDTLARRQIGLEGRQYVEREYSYQVWAPRVAALISEL